MIKIGSVVVCLDVFLWCAGLTAQQQISVTPRSRPDNAPVRPISNLRLDVRLVQIPVTVTDPRGKPLVQLPKTSFRLFEDDTERPITAFSVSDSPISATVVFDSSRSMKSRLHDARAAVEQFLNARLPGDEFSLVRFSDRAELLAPFTRDAGEVSRRLNFIQPKGWTALYDAVCLATQQNRKAHNQRKVVVVFSDGADNNSRYSESELIRLLREADVQVYAIGMFEKPRVLQRMTEETGGRALWVRRMEDLPAAVDTLNRQIRSEYLIGYSPAAAPNDGKYHRIRVEVQPPEGMERVRVSWRRGYLAPVE